MYSKIKEMNALEGEELAIFMNYIDPENKGYLDFQQFSEKIKPNMAFSDKSGNLKVIPWFNPSKEYT